VEGKLKAVVMKIDMSNVVGTLGVSAIELVGMGGVGKTSALICICHDADIKQKFIDGVSFSHKGKTLGLRTLYCSWQTWSRILGILYWQEKFAHVQILMFPQRRQARGAGRRSLFVGDDLWETDTNPTGFFAVLHKLIERLLCRPPQAH
jgi:GTPase SAR1 family protein